MKYPSIAVAALAAAAALCTGCVSRTYVHEMGAAPAGTVVAPASGTAVVVPSASATVPVEGTLCNDGTMLPPNSHCAMHGGVNANTTAQVPATH